MRALMILMPILMIGCSPLKWEVPVSVESSAQAESFDSGLDGFERLEAPFQADLDEPQLGDREEITENPKKSGKRALDIEGVGVSLKDLSDT